MSCGCGGMVETTPGAASGGTQFADGAGTLDGWRGTGGSPSVGGMASAVGGVARDGTRGFTAGGAASTCAAPGFFPDPVCGTTAAGTSITKGVTCTAADTQVCDKPCGPGNSGYKTVTCAAGIYMDGSCNFPADCWYGCFRVPTTDAPGCPATPPQHNQPCSLAICNLPCSQTTPCETCGMTIGYIDSSGNPRVGYCICIPSAAGGGKWACATYPTAWPCPAGAGC